jgi:hypothetical protein
MIILSHFLTFMISHKESHDFLSPLSPLGNVFYIGFFQDFSLYFFSNITTMCLAYFLASAWGQLGVLNLYICVFHQMCRVFLISFLFFYFLLSLSGNLSFMLDH